MMGKQKKNPPSILVDGRILGAYLKRLRANETRSNWTRSIFSVPMRRVSVGRVPMRRVPNRRGYSRYIHLVY